MLLVCIYKLPIVISRVGTNIVKKVFLKGYSVVGNFSLLSSMMVTGPSFRISTSICAWKRPVSTFNPLFLKRKTNLSKSASASSGGAASVKPGRRPFLVSAIKVNWLTAKSSPPMPLTDRLNFPWLSPKILSPMILSARYLASCSVSPAATPRRMTSPLPICPMTSWLTVTEALLTL